MQPRGEEEKQDTGGLRDNISPTITVNSTVNTLLQ